MPAPLSEILSPRLDRLLDPERFDDYCVNGLQVPGRGAGRDDGDGRVGERRAVRARRGTERAELLLVHHGLFWGSGVSAHRRRCSSAGCSCCSTRRWRWRRTTCRSTPTRSGQQRADRASARGERVGAVRAPHGQPIGLIAQLPGDGWRRRSWSGSVHAITAREPLVFASGPALDASAWRSSRAAAGTTRPTRRRRARRRCSPAR